MRTARITTNETCNQACRFCHARRPVDDPAFIRSRAVAARIAQACEQGATELVFTGGEPTLHGEFVGMALPFVLYLLVGFWRAPEEVNEQMNAFLWEGVYWNNIFPIWWVWLLMLSFQFF